MLKLLCLSVCFALMAKPLHQFKRSLAWKYVVYQEGYKVFFTVINDIHAGRFAKVSLDINIYALNTDRTNTYTYEVRIEPYNRDIFLTLQTTNH